MPWSDALCNLRTPREAVPIPAAALEDARQAEQQQQHAFCIAAPGAVHACFQAVVAARGMLGKSRS